MSSEQPIRVDGRLIDAWQRELRRIISDGDRASVQEDPADPHALRITFEVAGHTGYSLDFKCSYLDEREVEVSLVDVEKAGNSVDERDDIIQSIVKAYIRSIHECAQALEQLTNS